MAEITVNLVGAGRVGQTLLGLLGALPGYRVQDVMSTRLISARRAVGLAAQGRAIGCAEQMAPADLWIFAVPDNQISAAAEEISDTFGARVSSARSSTALHCSGFFAAEQLAPLRKLNWHLASLHPVLSFADPVQAMDQFKGTFCGIEGDASALTVIRPMIEALGAIPFEISSEGKCLYHAAAVISNNFAVVLQGIAREAWSAAGVPDEIARQLNAKLLRSTCENVIAQGPVQALTGPAARGDEFVVAQQAAELACLDPVIGEIYTQLSALARDMKAVGKVTELPDSQQGAYARKPKP